MPTRELLAEVGVVATFGLIGLAILSLVVVTGLSMTTRYEDVFYRWFPLPVALGLLAVPMLVATLIVWPSTT